MKSLYSLVVFLVAMSLILMPGAAYAQQYTNSDSTDNNPPISQPLVREGSFAVKLVDALRLGTASDEAQAESMLVSIGIAPRNGWISDYPVTPDIAVELRSAVSDAADAGQLPVGKDEALEAFQSVLVAFGLSVSPPDVAQAEGNAPSYSPDSTVINNYYYDYGPPVVTYYAPPPDFYYLYTWVPYPFWWWDFWFPGFFILADFVIDLDVHGHHHHWHGEQGGIVSNHFRDPATNRIERIDPVHRANGGTFSARRGGTGWASPSARRSAEAILAGNRNFTRSGNAVAPSRSGSVSGPFSGSRTFSPHSGARGTGPGAQGGRTFTAPSTTRRSTVPSFLGGRTFSGSVANKRSFAAPSGVSRSNRPSSEGRSFAAPSHSVRTYTSPSFGSRSSAPSHGAAGSFGSFSGGRTFSGSSGIARTFGGAGGQMGSFRGFHR
ncbi:MAG: hypothetical protein M1497_15555 [Nitrospirae bacterium]|nr:hypothetical protein [Nitrospirota bacterium]